MPKNDFTQPKIINGDMSVDDRGHVSFVNNFNFAGVKRFYMVSNHKEGFVRAWHAHKNEAKYVHVVKGAALIGAVKLDNWKSPSKDLEPNRFILSEHKPTILFIPKGFANGFMTLMPGTRVIFYSTATLSQSLNDDYRFDSRYWDIWSVEER